MKQNLAQSIENRPIPKPEAGRNTGRILRIKAGYNPNSSSVGSQIPYFFLFALSSGALTVWVLNFINRYDQKIRNKGAGPDDGAEVRND
ncbi:MAG: hypothetical protein D3926_05720 [Desulfobacteraceae bacterium]|nr:MAG: hypothetical protein D3926_05720 [Desulfobacteraceae bacterium]